MERDLADIRRKSIDGREVTEHSPAIIAAQQAKKVGKRKKCAKKDDIDAMILIAEGDNIAE